MEKTWVLLVVSTGLWTSAAALAVTASITVSMVLALWAGLTAVKAAVVTMWALMESIVTRERLRVEELTRLIAAGVLDEQASVTAIRR